MPGVKWGIVKELKQKLLLSYVLRKKNEIIKYFVSIQWNQIKNNYRKRVSALRGS